VALRVGEPFRRPVPEDSTLPRFHSPLIEPDVRISRIRISDKTNNSLAWAKADGAVAARLEE
jgi:hypothetical protein